MNFNSLLITLFSIGQLFYAGLGFQQNDERSPLVVDNQSWWKSAVIYQIYPRSFKDSNDDGIGDLPGIIEKLDYLAHLGIDAIWLSPVYPSPNADYGYDVADYRNIDPTFGNLEDFKTLLKECKQRHIRVIMDLVVNHTSDQHPWFKESRSSTNNPKRDWYIWRSGKNGAPPNNWATRVGDKSAWEFDEASGEYYLHSFFKEQPDLNWRSPEVLSEVKDIMRFWLDMGVSGFRLDVSNYYLKDEEFRDNPSSLAWDTLFTQKSYLTGWIYPYHFTQHIYDKDRPEVLDIYRELRQVANQYNAVLIGEIDSDNNIVEAPRSYGENDDGLNLAFNWDLPWLGDNASKILDTLMNWDAALQGKHPVIAFSNHDHPRHFTRMGNDIHKARLAALLTLTFKGTPVLYYGEELAMTDSYIVVIKDPLGIKMKPFVHGRDSSRGPMQWNSDDVFAGFSNVQPWLPIAHHDLLSSVARQLNDKLSMLNWYRTLIALRKELLMREHSLVFMPSQSKDVIMYKLVFADEEIVVALNFGGYEVDTELGLEKYGQIISSSYYSDEMTIDSKTHRLSPYEGFVLRTISTKL